MPSSDFPVDDFWNTTDTFSWRDAPAPTPQSNPGQTTRVPPLDTDDAHNWTRLDLIYDADGNLVRRETTFDDGIYKFVRFSDGVISQMETWDGSDTKPWASVVILYDAAGTPTLRETTFDNGSTRNVFYRDGAVDQIFDTDDAGEAPWAARSFRYDTDGNLVSQIVGMDNGVGIEQTFQNGFRTSLTITDHQDLHPWEERFTAYYDNSTEVYFTATTWDDGRDVVRHYENGMLTGWQQINTPDSVPFYNQIIRYDDTGAFETETTYFRGGVIQTKTFENGVLQRVEMEDTIPFPGNVLWETITKTYHDNGALNSRETVWDDGTTRLVQFDDTGTVTNTLVERPNQSPSVADAPFDPVLPEPQPVAATGDDLFGF